MNYTSLIIVFTLVVSSSGFLISKSSILSTNQQNVNSMQKLGYPRAQIIPVSIQKERKSVASIQTMGFFGLGLPELGIILFATILVLGPQKLGELTRNAGKMTAELSDELKEVPKEFQKGLKEGEIESRSRSAKPMKKVTEDE